MQLVKIYTEDTEQASLEKYRFVFLKILKKKKCQMLIVKFFKHLYVDNRDRNDKVAMHDAVEDRFVQFEPV